MCDTLEFQDIRTRTNFSGVYRMNIRRDSKRKSFWKLVYRSNEREFKDLDRSLLIESGRWIALGVFFKVVQASLLYPMTYFKRGIKRNLGWLSAQTACKATIKACISDPIKHFERRI